MLHEDNWFDADGNVLGDGDTNGIPDFAENLLPGADVEKAPYVENTGLNEAWIFMVVKQPTATTEEIAGVDDAGGLTGTDQQITVTAYAFQDNYKSKTIDTSNGVTDYMALWDSFGIDLDGNGNVPSTESRTPIFTLQDIDTANWIELKSDTETRSFLSEDGNLYSVYAYKTILPAEDDETTTDVTEDQTTPLFTSVELLKGISSKPAHAVKCMLGETVLGYVPFYNEESYIAVPEYVIDNGDGVVNTYNTWMSSVGGYYANGTSVSVKDIAPIQTKIVDDIAVDNYALDDIVLTVSTAVGSSDTSAPKLMPVSGTTAMVERAVSSVDAEGNVTASHVVETYNADQQVLICGHDESNGHTHDSSCYVTLNSSTVRGVDSVIQPTETRYSNSDCSQYYVYGLHSGKYYNGTEHQWGVLSVDEQLAMLKSMFTVSGNGYMVIKPAFDKADDYGYSSGAKILIYENTTNELVEEFTIICFSDLSGDGITTSTDTAIYWGYISRGDVGALSSVRESTILKVGDTNDDGVIDMADEIAALKQVLNSAMADQVTGYYYKDGTNTPLLRSTVCISPNGGTIDDSARTVNGEYQIALADDESLSVGTLTFTKYGYNFIGLSYDKSATTPDIPLSDGSATISNITADTRFYAVWQEKTTYTLTIKSNPTSAYSSSPVTLTYTVPYDKEIDLTEYLDDLYDAGVSEVYSKKTITGFQQKTSDAASWTYINSDKDVDSVTLTSVWDTATEATAVGVWHYTASDGKLMYMTSKSGTKINTTFYLVANKYVEYENIPEFTIPDGYKLLGWHILNEDTDYVTHTCYDEDGTAVTDECMRLFTAADVDITSTSGLVDISGYSSVELYPVIVAE